MKILLFIKFQDKIANQKYSQEYIGIIISNKYLSFHQINSLKLFIKSMNTQSIKKITVSQIKRTNFTNITKQQFKKKYGYLQDINKGAQGIVKKGHDGIRPVAIKKYFKQSVRSDLIKYVIAQISILSQFNHPNILGFFQSYRIQGRTQHEDQFCVVTQLCQGSLENYQDIKQLMLSQKVRILKEIASGLAYAHQKGIAHRDIKPDNILVMNLKEFKGIKLADFGCSKKLEGNLMTSSIGTPIYSDPNIFTKDYTQKCDIFSLGQLSQFIFCGRNIFSDCESMRQLNDAKQKLFRNLQKQIKKFIKAQENDRLIQGDQSNFLQLVMCYTLSQNQEKRLSAKQLQQIFQKAEEKFKQVQQKKRNSIKKQEFKQRKDNFKVKPQNKPQMKTTQSILIQEQRLQEAIQIKKHIENMTYNDNGNDIVSQIQQQELQEALRLSRQLSSQSSINESNFTLQSDKNYYLGAGSQINIRNSQFINCSDAESFISKQNQGQNRNLKPSEKSQQNVINKFNQFKSEFKPMYDQSIFQTVVYKENFQENFQDKKINDEAIKQQNQNNNNINRQKEKVKCIQNRKCIDQRKSSNKFILQSQISIQQSQYSQSLEKNINLDQSSMQNSYIEIDNNEKIPSTDCTDIKKSVNSSITQQSFSKHINKNKRHSIQILSQKRLKDSISNSMKEVKKEVKMITPLNCDKHMSYQQMIYVKYLKVCKIIKQRQQVISTYKKLLQGLKISKEKWKVIKKIQEISSQTLKNQQKQCIVFLFNTIYIYVLEDYERFIAGQHSSIATKLNIHVLAFTQNQITTLSNYIYAEKMRVSPYTFKLAQSLHKSAMYIQPKLTQFFQFVIDEIRKSRNQLNSSQVEIVVRKFHLNHLKIQFQILIDSIKQRSLSENLTQTQCQNVIGNLQKIREAVISIN